MPHTSTPELHLTYGYVSACAYVGHTFLFIVTAERLEGRCSEMMCVLGPS